MSSRVDVPLHDDRKVEVVLHEYNFVSSMIALYRGFQFRIVGLGIVVYGAVGALIGDAVRADSGPGERLLLTVLAFLPSLQVLLIAALTMTELRIVRASRYLLHDLYPRFRRLCGEQLLGYEREPSKHLNVPEKWLSTSLPLFAVLVLPAFAGVVFYLFQDDAPVPLIVPLAGLAALLVYGGVGAYTTWQHERRAS